MRNRNLFAFISGIAFIVLGVVFAADALDWVDVSAGLVFPVVMIAVGVGVVVGARGRRERRDEPPPLDRPSDQPSQPTEPMPPAPPDLPKK